MSPYLEESQTLKHTLACSIINRNCCSTFRHNCFIPLAFGHYLHSPCQVQVLITTLLILFNFRSQSYSGTGVGVRWQPVSPDQSQSWTRISLERCFPHRLKHSISYREATWKQPDALEQVESVFQWAAVPGLTLPLLCCHHGCLAGRQTHATINTSYFLSASITTTPTESRPGLPKDRRSGVGYWLICPIPSYSRGACSYWWMDEVRLFCVMQMF